MKLENGADGKAQRHSGRRDDPLNKRELGGKLREMAEALAPPDQHSRIVDLCGRLETISTARKLSGALALDALKGTVDVGR